MSPVRRYLEGRLAEPHRLRHGLVILAATGLAYAACLLLLALGGARPGTTPWLRIATARYFYWEAIFIAPVIVLAGILAAAVMYLLARRGGGRGSFDDTLALTGLATGWCTLTTVVPDTGVALLLCARVVSARAWMHAITHPTVVLAMVWLYLGAYLVAFLWCYPRVVAVVHRLERRRALAIGSAGFLVYQGLLLVFVR